MGASGTGAPTVGALESAAAILREADRQLLDGDGVAALVADPVARAGLAHHGDRAAGLLAEIEARLDASALDGADIESLNAALVTCKDALWSMRKDRIDLATAVEDLLAGMPPGPAALGAFHAVEITLSAIDRLEVRGRDSAGLHVVVTGHGLDLDDPAIARLVSARSADPLFTAGSVRVGDGHLAFVYKTAAEIGELGDNTARLRAQIRDDELLHLALRADTAQASVLAHTRWASIGIISEANAHPLNQEELDGDGRIDGSPRTWSPRSTATSTTTPISRRSTGSTSRPRSRPTPRSSPHSSPAVPARVPVSSRRSGRRSRRSKARSRSPCSRRPTPTPCCSLSAGAVRRSMSASRPTRSWLRASRTASWRNVARTFASTARRWSIPATPRARAR